jgi:parvulin-like peptidyl-prolyl isomerase
MHKMKMLQYIMSVRFSTQSKISLVIVFGLILFANTLIAQTAKSSADDTLAIVGKKVITADAFSATYIEKKAKYGLSDNLDIRKGYLDNLIADEILINKAKRDRLDITKESKAEKDNIYKQELLNAFSNYNVLANVSVSEDNMVDLFSRMNTKIKVCHLYSATKTGADSLYDLLLKGMEFSDLARQVFSDKTLKESSGSLGYIGMDEMDPDFENAAYSMKIGETSRPVKTVQGYSIIKVEDVKRNPFITEGEFQKAKSRIKRFAYSRKCKEAVKNYTNDLRSGLSLKFNDQLIAKLFTLVQQNKWEKLAENNSLKFTPRELRTSILTSKNGNWSISDLLARMCTVKENQHKYIRTKENLEDMIAGLFMREQIIVIAKKEHLDASPAFQEKVNYAFDSYLLSVIENKYRTEIVISDDSVRSYYMHNKEIFVTEPEIRLSVILLDNKSLIDSIKSGLAKQVPFEELAKSCSVQASTAERGGDIGFFNKKDLGRFGDDIYSLNINDWKGPFVDDNKYLFVKCTEHKQAERKSFNDVAAEIKESLISIEWLKVRDAKVQSLKNEITWHAYPEKLKTLTLN